MEGNNKNSKSPGDKGLEDTCNGTADANNQIPFPNPIDIPPCDFFRNKKTSENISKDST